ncbi:MAG: hypothetical protein GX616_03575 [Planctomycetes bacterium]|nr:hypothetical protein [Planctomycetota bacterium]
MEDAADALEHIYHAGLPAPAARGEYTAAELAAYRPYIVVHEEAYAVDRISTSGWQAGGEIIAAFFEDVPTDELDSPAESYVTMRDAIKAILAQLANASQQTAGYLMVRQYAIEEGPYRFDLDEEPVQGYAQWCVTRIAYGEGGR